MSESTCPNCGAELKREYGISGVVLICKCGKEWIKCLDRLMSRDEFHARVAAEQ
jgi:hypothetical protein